MSHFYGTLQGARGPASRCGSKGSGMETFCASWKGAIRSEAFIDKATGEDWVRVEMTPWQGHGQRVLIYLGPIGQFENHARHEVN